MDLLAQSIAASNSFSPLTERLAKLSSPMNSITRMAQCERLMVHRCADLIAEDRHLFRLGINRDDRGTQARCALTHRGLTDVDVDDLRWQTGGHTILSYKALLIVGAVHKAFLEVYLRTVTDVEIVLVPAMIDAKLTELSAGLLDKWSSEFRALRQMSFLKISSFFEKPNESGGGGAAQQLRLCQH